MLWGAALDQEEHFEVICAIVKVVVFMPKNAIV